MSVNNKHSIKANALLNVVKQLCSILFPLITIPYVTRILQAENLGKVNFSASIVSYFAMIAQMGIANYAIREGAKLRNNKLQIEEFSNEVFTFNIFTMMISYVLMFGFICFCRPIQNYSLLIIIQSATVLFTTIGVDWVNNIFEDFFAITLRTIIVQIVSLVLMFMFVRNINDYVIYAIITVVAQCGAYLFNAFSVRKYVKIKLTFSIKILNHLKPILFLFSNNIAMMVYINSDTTMIGFMVGDSAVAIYYIATKMYTVIKNIINAIIVVALPRLSNYVEHNKKAYNELCTTVLTSVLTVLVPAVVGLFCCSNFIVKIIAGQEFVGGGTALKILSISLLFAVLGGFNKLCVVMPNREEKILLLATSFAAIINIALNFILIPIWSYNGAALTTVIAEAIVAIITYISTRKYTNIKISKNVVLSIGIGCVFIAICCLFIQRTVVNDFLTLVMSIVTSVIIYGVALIVFKNPLIMLVKERLFKSV